jgi:hypothetical protein
MHSMLDQLRKIFRFTHIATNCRGPRAQTVRYVFGAFALDIRNYDIGALTMAYAGDTFTQASGGTGDYNRFINQHG